VTATLEAPVARDRKPSRFTIAVAAIAAGALLLRVFYVLLERRGTPITGDAYFYHRAAELLADGNGFIGPYQLDLKGITVDVADHPPAYIVYLALWSLLGVHSPTGHLLASCLLGAATVVVLAFVGRAIGGARVGIIAAVVAAIYPNLFAYDGMLLSETTAILATALVLLAWYRSPRNPWWAVALLGALCGLAALTRAELILLAPLLILPRAWRGDRPWRQRLALVAVGAVATVAVIAPWVIYNTARFGQLVTLSNGLDVTLAQANCDPVYRGDQIGFYRVQCAIDAAAAAGLTTDDQLELGRIYRRAAIDYVEDHVDRVPLVVLARLGRVTGTFRPLQQIDLDVFPEGRDRWVATSGMFGWWLLAGFGVAGVVVLRRQRTPVWPLLAPGVIVLLVTVLTFGSTRYRAPFEPCVVLLGAVGIEAALRRLGLLPAARPGDHRATAATPAPTTPP
jgi:4-amino-4-deoxy-L-arabinose transferase-like glycosyltransferase